MTTVHNHMRLCLVSPPGSIRAATCATVAQVENLRLVSIVAGALTVTKVLQRLPCDLILLDANVPAEETAALLEWLGDFHPALWRVVATLTSEQSRQALAQGADFALRRDELALKLPACIDKMLWHGRLDVAASPLSEDLDVNSV